MPRRWGCGRRGRGGGHSALEGWEGAPRHPRSLASGDTRTRPAERAGHVLPAGFACHLPDSRHSFPLKGSEVKINTNKPPRPAGAPRPELSPPRLSRAALEREHVRGREQRGEMLKPPPRWSPTPSPRCGPGQEKGSPSRFNSADRCIWTPTLSRGTGDSQSTKSRFQESQGRGARPLSQEPDSAYLQGQCPPPEIPKSSESVSSPLT